MMNLATHSNRREYIFLEIKNESKKMNNQTNRTEWKRNRSLKQSKLIFGMVWLAKLLSYERRMVFYVYFQAMGIISMGN